jgi:hypothetical protein
MIEVVVEAEGPNAEENMRFAGAFFEQEFRVPSQLMQKDPEPGRKGIDPAWIAVTLAIPPAILAGMELSDRLRLIERTDAMLTQLRARLGKAAGVIRIGARRSFDLISVKGREIIDAIRESKDDL